MTVLVRQNYPPSHRYVYETGKVGVDRGMTISTVNGPTGVADSSTVSPVRSPARVQVSSSGRHPRHNPSAISCAARRDNRFNTTFSMSNSTRTGCGQRLRHLFGALFLAGISVAPSHAAAVGRTAPAAGWRRRSRCRTAGEGHESTAQYAVYRHTRFRMRGQRRLGHRLTHLEALGRLAGGGGLGFVDLDRHTRKNRTRRHRRHLPRGAGR